jgi:hypothetical protein
MKVSDFNHEIKIHIIIEQRLSSSILINQMSTEVLKTPEFAREKSTAS